MHILYFLFVKTVEWLLPIAAFLSNNKKLRLFVSGRKVDFRNTRLTPNPNRYWFHCASLGEFEQARPVIEKLKSQDPSNSIIISFFSPSGFEQRKHYDLAEAVIYLPLDTPSNAKNLMEWMQPKAAIFVKYEIWYFYLKTLFSKHLPVYLISANFRSNQSIFHIWGQWLFRLLPQYKQIFLQNDTAYQLLKNKGLNNLTLSGDTRYDRVLQNAEKVKANTIIETFKANQPLLILGSSWPAEEDCLLRYLESISKENKILPYKIIIAPHDISNEHVADIQNKFKVWQPGLYTENIRGPILIMNTIGHLASAYHYADIALIGGGFTGQLHNILEPLAFGVPVITGPIHHKFPEAELAKKEGLLFEISDSKTLANILNETEKLNLKDRAKSFINQQAGASEIVVHAILG